MKKAMIAMLAGVIVLGLIGQAFSNNSNRTDDPLGVAIAPQTLILSTTQSGSVVVHTAIPLSSVDRTSLTLNGVPARSTGADSLGHLIANFAEAEIEAIVAVPSATLTLSGTYTNGESFAGSDTVRVIE